MRAEKGSVGGVRGPSTGPFRGTFRPDRPDGEHLRPEPEPTTRGFDVPGAAAPRRQSPSILLIDGYPALTDVLHELLSGDGWRVRKAYDGAAGLRLAEMLRPDIVFCDLELRSRPDAHELACILRERFAGAPIVLVGLTTMQWGGPDARPTGFDAVLRKPVDIEPIEAIIRQHG